MKIYFNKPLIIKNVLKLQYEFRKSFSVEGKLKSKESNLKHKNYSVFNLFDEEKPEENNISSNSYQSNFHEDVSHEEKEKINEIPEKRENYDIPKEQVEQPLFKLEKSHIKDNSQFNSIKVPNPKQNVRQSEHHEQLIDRMLLQKSSNYQSNYNYNNSNYNNNINKYQNNTTQTTSPNLIQKRQKISFVREGMLLTLYLKKVIMYNY
jgi:hypothetical protein